MSTINLGINNNPSTTKQSQNSILPNTWLGRHAKWIHEKSFSPNRLVRTCAKIWTVVFTALMSISLIFLPKAFQFQKLLSNLTKNFLDEPKNGYLDGSCDNFLKSSFFNPYLAQLKFVFDQQVNLKTRINQLIPSPFKDCVLELYEHIKAPPTHSSIEINRIYYNKFLNLVRNCQKETCNITSTTDEPFIYIRNFLDKFIQNYMQATVTYKPGMDFLYKMGLSKDLAIKDMSEIPHLLELGFKQLSHHKHSGFIEGVFDPFLLGNIPYQMFELQTKNGKNITVFRCPNITKDEVHVKGKLSKASIGKQFEFFLESCHRQNKKHLYINLMQRTLDNESVRTGMIESLEAKYAGTLNVVSLDRNSHFYLQFQSSNNLAKDFKEEFKKHLRNENYYSWSADLKRDIWYLELDTIIENLHLTFFQSDEFLSLEQKQAFIELTYCVIIDSLIAKFEPDSANFSCKVCVDRGGLTNTMMYLYYLIKEQGNIQPNQFNYLQYLIYAPALLASNRPIQKVYFDRLVTFAKIFLKSNKPLSCMLPKNDYIQGIRTREISSIFEQPKEKLPFDTLTLNIFDRIKWHTTTFPTRKKLPLLTPAQRLEVESRYLDKLPKITEMVLKRIAQFNIPLEPLKTHEIVDIVAKHYILTMQYYSPAIIKWMDSLLHRNDKKFVFLARDGIILNEVASILLKRDPKRYHNVSKDKLVVAWLSRKSAQDAASRGNLTKRYFRQLGIRSDEPILLVDTGVSGSIKREIATLVKNPIECQFSVSRNPAIHGFWDNCDFSLQALAFVTLPSDHEDAWANDPKAANDWVEDTHRGNFIGAEKLVEKHGIIYPYPSMEWINTGKGKKLITKETSVNSETDLKDFLVREFGRKAIVDFAEEVDISDSTLNYDQIKLNLNDLLTRIQKNQTTCATVKHD